MNSLIAKSVRKYVANVKYQIVNILESVLNYKIEAMNKGVLFFVEISLQRQA